MEEAVDQVVAFLEAEVLLEAASVEAVLEVASVEADSLEVVLAEVGSTEQRLGTMNFLFSL